MLKSALGVFFSFLFILLNVPTALAEDVSTTDASKESIPKKTITAKKAQGQGWQTWR